MKIVGISACTAGIVHTYMAQETLEQECKGTCALCIHRLCHRQ